MPKAPPIATTATFRAMLPKRKIARSKSTVIAMDKAISTHKLSKVGNIS